MKRQTSRYTMVAFAALAVVGMIAGRVDAENRRIRQNLATTGVDPDARGQARVQIQQRGNDLRGRLDLHVRRLDPHSTFEVDVQGVRIGTITTTDGGSGHARFSSQPTGRDELLGVDPRGKQIEIRNAAGDNVMETEVPEQGMDPTKIRCCLPDDDDSGEQPECEDRTADQCTAAGGVNLGSGSCLPNPCEGATPPAPEDSIVCCTPEDDSAPECELRSAAQCSERGGVNLGAGVCDPNPCTPTSPAEPETIQCCIPDDSGPECEDRTPELCTAQGGTNMGPGTCSPNPCTTQPPAEQTRCCVPGASGEVECEDRTPDQCAAQGGTDIGPGVCDPSACAAAPPPPEQNRCCVPKHEGPECEDRTPDECAARGGASIGPGSCVPNPCN